MSGITRDFIESLSLKDSGTGLSRVSTNLLERILSIPDYDMNKRKDRTRKITLVGKYPNYHSVNISELQKYDPNDRLWKEKQQDLDNGSSRRRGEFPSISTEPSGRLSHQISQLSSDSDRGVFNRPMPLRLPPIILPPMYTVKPTPLLPRDFSVRTLARGPITDQEWDELTECRYLRPGLKKFRTVVYL